MGQTLYFHWSRSPNQSNQQPAFGGISANGAQQVTEQTVVRLGQPNTPAAFHKKPAVHILPQTYPTLLKQRMLLEIILCFLYKTLQQLSIFLIGEHNCQNISFLTHFYICPSYWHFKKRVHIIELLCYLQEIYFPQSQSFFNFISFYLVTIIKKILHFPILYSKAFTLYVKALLSQRY